MACSYCKRTDGSHSKGCRKKDGCKLCARVAPKKCKRHAKSQGGEIIAVSRRLFEAVKLHDEPGYRIAQRAGLTASVLSNLLHGAVRIRPQDPRVLAVAEVVGVPPERAFEHRSR
jgi:transcriptional regulator with XRE-family HTH domain